jgi:orotate phosphoribosyltransferase
LREHSLILGEVTLASGATAQYYVDARRALMRPAGFRAAGELISARAHELGATAVGGPATAAIPPACAAIAGAGGEDLVAFFVRGSRKEHGLQRWVEGPVEAGVRCLVVEDTVTTGGSTATAVERVREEGLEVAGVVAVVDRLAGGAERIEAAAAAPYSALITIDEIYPDRPDRG